MDAELLQWLRERDSEMAFCTNWRNLRVAMQTPTTAPHDGNDPTAAALATLYDNYHAQTARATSQTWLALFDAKQF